MICFEGALLGTLADALLHSTLLYSARVGFFLFSFFKMFGYRILFPCLFFRMYIVCALLILTRAAYQHVFFYYCWRSYQKESLL